MAALIGVAATKGGGYICKVPLDLLAQDGVPPEQGDDVSYSVEGTVKSVDAEDATVSITSVNGEPVAESPSDEAAEDDTGEGNPGNPGGSTGGPPPPPPAGGAAIGKVGPISPGTAALGAALRKRAKGKPMPF
jgi:hypothetical protein